jgi:serine/threonine protein kinase
VHDPASGPDPLVGQLFDQRYQVLRRIGAGGMGAVYEATQVAMNRPVALKVLLPGLHRDEVVQRFEREMKTSSRLAHPNIVRVYDWGKAPDGSYFLAMELLNGESLKARLTRGALPVEVAIGVAQQLLKALAAAHAEHIVHRDLKPENVMLCTVHGEPDQVRVLDFGIATFGPHAAEAGERITATGMLVGTPTYISPEQIGGDGVDARADLYLFGLVLFEMLAGRAPFEDKARPMRVLHLHMSEKPRPVSAVASQPIPGWLDALVSRLLEKDPNDRPASALAVLEEVQRNSVPVGTPAGAQARLSIEPSAVAVAPTEGPGAKLAQAASSSPPWFVGALVLVVGVLFGVIGLVLGKLF